MISNENKFIVKFLFPNTECLMFFKDQLFEELKVVLPRELCYTKSNTSSKARQENKVKCLRIIQGFFTKNKVYADEVQQLYNKTIGEVCEDVLQGFVFLLNPQSNPLENKESVCYIEGIKIKDLI